MKIMAREYEKAAAKPYHSYLLRILGFFQFIGATWVIFLFSAVFEKYLGPNGVIICYIVAFIVGTFASLSTFVLAQIVDYLHAIRWNTDSFNVEHEKGDFRALAVAVNTLTENIQAIVGNAREGNAPEAPEAYDPNHDPFDDFEEE